MRRLYSILAVALLVAATGAYAATITVAMTAGGEDTDISDGVGHFTGATAVGNALAAINADAVNGPGSTITITEAGTYLGQLAVMQQNVTIEAAAGVAVTLQGIDAWGLHVGINPYTGWNQADGSGLTLRGDSPANPLVLKGSGQPDGACAGVWNGNDITWENIRFRGHDIFNTRIAVELHSSILGGLDLGQGFFWNTANQTFNDCIFDIAGSSLYQVGVQFNGPAESPSHFNRCTFLNSGPGPDNGWPPHNVLTSTSIFFTDCSFQGGLPVMQPNWHGLTERGRMDLVYTRCSFVGVKEACTWDWGGDGGVVNGLATQVFDACTFAADADGHPRWVANVGSGSIATIKNCAINLDQQTWGVGANINGTLNLENVVAYGTGVSQVLSAWTPTANLNIEHCTFVANTPNPMLNCGEGAIVTMDYSIVDASRSANATTINLDFTGTRNILWNGADSGAVGAMPAGTLVTIPLASANGHLLPGSPALGAAEGSAAVIDFEGDARPLGGAVNDIGADESDLSEDFAGIITTNITLGFIEEGMRLELYAPVGALGPFQWRLDGAEVIDDGVRISGAQTATLVLDPVLEIDSGTYSVTYDDGAAKDLAQSVPLDVDVLPAGSLPAAGLVGLSVLASLIAAGGAHLFRRNR